jgi:DNA-binding NarL/FixJ family response regulator
LTGVVGGLVAAVLWGASGVSASRSARAIGAEAALAWVYVVGLAVVVPLAFVADGLPGGGARPWTYAVVAVVGAVSSLYFMYAALGRGPVALVMPLTAAQGGLAALVAVAAGESLHVVAAVALAAMMIGMYLAMRRPREPERSEAHSSPAVVLAALSAATAAFALFAAPRAAHGLGTLWMLAALRIGGVVGVTAPTALTHRLRVPRGVVPFVVFSGCADAGAFGTYIYAAKVDGIVVPAVLSSQYAAVAAVMAALLLGATSEMLRSSLRAAEAEAARRAGDDPLSEREHEVLRLLALGHTNQEIAKQLFISVRTAETHRAHIMQKLHLQSRAELVRYALAHDLLEEQ